MAEETIEIVIKTDCFHDGELLSRGEVRSFPKSAANELRAAGRVCTAEEAEAALAFRKAADTADKGKGKASA